MAPDVPYVGGKVCRSCHEDIYDTYKETGMGRSLYTPDADHVVEDYVRHNVIHDARSGYSYRMYTEQGRFYQKEFRLDEHGREVHALTREVKYVIGSGNHVRSYLTEINGFAYEMPVSWYSEKKKWDLSPGYQKRNQRFSRVLLQECIGCHNSYVKFYPGSVNKYGFPFEEGISCERCHGPGEAHVNFRLRQKTGERDRMKGMRDTTIVHPGRLGRQEQLDVCQQCHFPGIMQVAKPGKDDYDFRPGMRLSEIKTIYVGDTHGSEQFGIASHTERLHRSACFVKSGTMTCVTCHNPHVTVYQTPRAVFNGKCTACHTPGQLTDARVAFSHAGKHDCVSCHMKQGGTSDIPHVVFTDHWIRRQPGLSKSASAGTFSMMEQTSSDTSLVRLEDFFSERDSMAGLRLGIAYYKYFWNKRRDDAYLQRARELLMEEVRRFPLSAEGHFYLGLAEHAGGRFESARAAFERAIEINDRFVKARFWLADCFLQTGRYDTAAVLLESEAALMPHDPQIYLKWGNAMGSRGNWEGAVQIYHKALKVNPDFVDARMNLALIYYSRLGQVDEAEYLYGKVIELEPDHGDAFFNLGNIFYAQKRIGEAATAYRKAIMLRPQNPGAYANLAMLHRDLQEWDKAIACLTEGVRANPGNEELKKLRIQMEGSLPRP